MTIDQFITQTRLQPGDAVIVKKKNIGLLDHYLVYLGNHFGDHKFIANYMRGTRILSGPELQGYAETFIPERIRKFKGNDIQRQAAVQRALNRCDENSYHLLLNNCEHFANYVQEGRSYSQQTTTFGTGMAITGLAVAASAKNSQTRNVGAAMAVLGLFTLLMENNNNK
jgi:hypothetical protein